MLERLGQMPALERDRLVEGVRFGLDQREVMQRLGHEYAGAVAALMPGDLDPVAQDHEAGVGVRQVHAEEVDLPTHAADHGDRFAEVDLGVAGRVGQRHKGLPPLRPADPHVILHHRVAAGIAVLVAQTLKDPLGRMPLLDRCSPIRLQNRRDHRQKRPELRRLDRLRARVARRQREPAHLGDRLPAQPKYPNSLTPRVAFNKDELPNSRIDFHGKHPQPLSKEKPLHWPAYPARISTSPTLQWMVLSPPYTRGGTSSS